MFNCQCLSSDILCHFDKHKKPHFKPSDLNDISTIPAGFKVIKGESTSEQTSLNQTFILYLHKYLLFFLSHLSAFHNTTQGQPVATKFSTFINGNPHRFFTLDFLNSHTKFLVSGFNLQYEYNEKNRIHTLCL